MSDEQWYTNNPEEPSAQPDQAARRALFRGIALGMALMLALGFVAWMAFGQASIGDSMAIFTGGTRTTALSSMISAAIAALLVVKLARNPRVQAAHARYEQRKRPAALLVLIGIVVALIIGLFRGL